MKTSSQFLPCLGPFQWKRHHLQCSVVAGERLYEMVFVKSKRSDVSLDPSALRQGFERVDCERAHFDRIIAPWFTEKDLGSGRKERILEGLQRFVHPNYDMEVIWYQATEKILYLRHHDIEVISLAPESRMSWEFAHEALGTTRKGFKLIA